MNGVTGNGDTYEANSNLVINRAIDFCVKENQNFKVEDGSHPGASQIHTLNR